MCLIFALEGDVIFLISKSTVLQGAALSLSSPTSPYTDAFEKVTYARARVPWSMDFQCHSFRFTEKDSAPRAVMLFIHSRNSYCAPVYVKLT